MREFTLVVVLGAALVGTSSAQPGSIGCFGDDRSDRVLLAKLSSRVMTPTVCADYCRTESSRFTYYATQYGQECWCQEENIDLRHGEGTCDFPCSGDESIVCGGFDSFSLYDLPRSTADDKYVGCFADDRDDRVLATKMSSSEMTSEACASYCANESPRNMYYATQWGQECWCSAEVDLRHGEGTCDFPYTGDAGTTCGGFDAFHLFELEGVDPLPPSEDFYLGSFADDQRNRVLEDRMSSGDMSLQVCEDYCMARDKPFFALQWGQECWCGGCELLDEEVRRFDRHGAASCVGHPCTGEASRSCGGFDAFSLYYRGTCDGSPTIEPSFAPTASPTSHPTLDPTNTITPTATPTNAPIAEGSPTIEPSFAPTTSPISHPTLDPTNTATPTTTPTNAPIADGLALQCLPESTSGLGSYSPFAVVRAYFVVSGGQGEITFNITDTSTTFATPATFPAAGEPVDVTMIALAPEDVGGRTLSIELSDDAGNTAVCEATLEVVLPAEPTVVVSAETGEATSPFIAEVSAYTPSVDFLLEGSKDADGLPDAATSWSWVDSETGEDVSVELDPTTQAPVLMRQGGVVMTLQYEGDVLASASFTRDGVDEVTVELNIPLDDDDEDLTAGSGRALELVPSHQTLSSYLQQNVGHGRRLGLCDLQEPACTKVSGAVCKKIVGCGAAVGGCLLFLRSGCTYCAAVGCPAVLLFGCLDTFFREDCEEQIGEKCNNAVDLVCDDDDQDDDKPDDPKRGEAREGQGNSTTGLPTHSVALSGFP